jgi:hypothetical protein
MARAELPRRRRTRERLGEERPELEEAADARARERSVEQRVRGYQRQTGDPWAFEYATEWPSNGNEKG